MPACKGNNSGLRMKLDINGNSLLCFLQSNMRKGDNSFNFVKICLNILKNELNIFLGMTTLTVIQRFNNIIN
jgi:hypothetical protein